MEAELKKTTVYLDFVVFNRQTLEMAWRQVLFHRRGISFLSQSDVVPGSSRFYSTSTQYIVKVGIPEFLKGIGRGVETHIPKLESEIGDFHKLLITRTYTLKTLGIPVKQRKLILKYTHKYRLGLWRPRADLEKHK